MNKKGQLVILASVSLMITIIIMAAVVTAGELRIRRSQEVSFPVSLFNAVDDAPRALTVALSLASEVYMNTRDINEANETAFAYLSSWVNDFTKAYSGKGVIAYFTYRIDFEWDNTEPPWRSIIIANLTVKAEPIGFNYLKLNYTVGLLVINPNVIVSVIGKKSRIDAFNVTVIDVSKNMGVPVSILKLALSRQVPGQGRGPIIRHLYYYYYGSGINGFKDLTPRSQVIIVEEVYAYFKYNGIIVGVHIVAES
ncbi:MAG: hypothetical protein DRJ20_02540 [Candidatus Methanomethylicota archaeon]|uniref:Uncharacterized protein n=1 Tax=Thermoproteota archaeon TaxID=2056631 RepID=A0A497EVZ4_9CREN|nr:MAG: hypothetical protein DRJ20_02540 [Candidatus Verstraetearchaeota archaeon]